MAWRNTPVMTVKVEVHPAKKGTSGTQEVSISAELICPDAEADSESDRFAKVWKAESSLGTISRKAAQTGKIPNSMDENIAEFFGKFRAAYNRSVRAAKESKDAASVDRHRIRS